MENWMLFENGEAEYLAWLRQGATPGPYRTAAPGRPLRQQLAAALVALAAWLSPPDSSPVAQGAR